MSTYIPEIIPNPNERHIQKTVDIDRRLTGLERRAQGNAIIDGDPIRKKGYTITANGTTKSWVFNHNLSRKDLVIEVYEAFGDEEKVYPKIEHEHLNDVRVSFRAAPAVSKNYRVFVVG